MSRDTSQYALLIDYEFCTGCHSCEIACKKELELPFGKYGIKLLEYGPTELGGDRWEWDYVPFPTKLCNLCEARVATGRLPACVHNCPADCMQFGTIEELAPHLALKPNRVVFSPR